MYNVKFSVNPSLSLGETGCSQVLCYTYTVLRIEDNSICWEIDVFMSSVADLLQYPRNELVANQ